MGIAEVLDLIEWPEDINRDKTRYERALKEFLEVFNKIKLNYDFPLTILEVAGGTGIGGIAITKALISLGFAVQRLIITDIREEALSKAKEFSKQELKVEADTFRLDAREVHKLGIKADLILMYGNSHASFSTFDMAKFIISSKISLKETGILVIQGHNMLYDFIITSGYKQVVPEKVRGDKVVISIHEGYDEYNGTFKRIFIDLVSGRRAELDLRYWDFGEIIGLCRVFFKDVELLLTERHRGVILCRNPLSDITSVLV